MSLLYEVHSSLSHERNIHEIFLFCSTWPFRYTWLRGYGIRVLRSYEIEALHVLGHIWLWGYRCIEFSDFLKYFLKLGRNPDVQESNGLRIRFQREKNTWEYHSVILCTEIFFFWPVLLIKIKDMKNIDIPENLYSIYFSICFRIVNLYCLTHLNSSLSPQSDEGCFPWFLSRSLKRICTSLCLQRAAAKTPNLK